MKNNLENRIAIIGGTGFIGRSIYKAFKTLDYKVVYTSRQDLNISNDKNCLKFDLLNKSTWETLLNEFKPNIVICLLLSIVQNNLSWISLRTNNFNGCCANCELCCLKSHQPILEKHQNLGLISQYRKVYTISSLSRKTKQIS